GGPGDSASPGGDRDPARGAFPRPGGRLRCDRYRPGPPGPRGLGGPGGEESPGRGPGPGQPGPKRRDQRPDSGRGRVRARRRPAVPPDRDQSALAGRPGPGGALDGPSLPPPGSGRPLLYGG